MAQVCAESLSGLVIHQLRRPGAPFIFGGMASLMDMRSTVFSYGAPEFQLGNAMLAEMAHYFGLPNFETAGTSDSHLFDGQALVEATSSCLMAALTGANLIHDVGLLGSATVVMPEMIVATNEIVSMIGGLVGEVKVDSEALALDVIGDVGPGGEFVTHPHTLAHFRDVWYSDLFVRTTMAAGANRGERRFEERVNERTRELIERPWPEPLPLATIDSMQEIIAEAQGG